MVRCRLKKYESRRLNKGLNYFLLFGAFFFEADFNFFLNLFIETKGGFYKTNSRYRMKTFNYNYYGAQRRVLLFRYLI